jgi:DNA-binding transcriptional regulator YhcF (GntR family)
MSSNILVIAEKQGVTKLQTLTDALREAIASGSFGPGDSLPSINELSRLSGFSRDTVVKAYNILREQSVVEATPAKGFFVSRVSQKVFMLLDDFSPFKEQLYRSFRDNLPGEYSVDLLFHHYNEHVFEQLINHATGRYSTYIIMNVSNKKLHPVLSKIDPARLLLLDMGSQENPKLNYLLQNFDEAVTFCMEQEMDRIKKYTRLIFVFSRNKTPHPPETEPALRKFCRKHGIRFQLMPEIQFELIKPGQLFFVITESDLVKVLKGCRHEGLDLGSELGIIAYNDTPMKEIAGNGITVISVDFGEMGRKAADFVKSKSPIREVLPTRLILRGSL